MKIGFNLLPYSPGEQGGAEEYIRNIVTALSRIDNDHKYVLFVTPSIVGKYKPDRRCFNEVVLPYWCGARRITRVLAEQVVLPYYAYQSKIDCLVSNYVVPVLAPVPQIAIIHDMLYKRYPEAFEKKKLAYWKITIPLTIRFSKAIVTVSQFSRSEIICFFPEANEKVFVTVEGVKPSLLHASDIDEPLLGLESKGYFLCVATFGKHKNLNALLRAFALIHKSYPNIKLVLVGGARTPEAQQNKKTLTELAFKEGVLDDVIFTGHVSDDQLAWLYQNAIALVLTSFYEGFGLPIIEAQHFGCPVLCSNVASMPEIGGLGALTFDPFSIESIKDAMAKVLNQPGLTDDLRNRGYSNVARFSWEEAARQLLEVVEWVAPSKKNCITP